MALPKQPVSVFFGATDQDTGKKGVKLGNLIIAENVQQIKGGEFTKRYGFTQMAQTYEGQASLSPDSIVSPNGTQSLTRDAVTGHVFSRGATNTSNVDRGNADRFIPVLQTRFPALGSGKQIAPMAKQCGEYIVYLEDEGHFRIVELNPGTANVEGSPTWEPDAIVRQSNAISVSAVSSADSTKVTSFALLNYTLFDAVNVWLLWVDQSSKIYSLKIPRTNLNGGTFHTVYTAPETTQYKKYFTSITACMVEGPHLAVAACGIGIDTTANYLSPGVGGTAATGFRKAGTSPSNYGQSFSVHGHLDASTSEFSSYGSYADPFSAQVGCACTMLSSYGFQLSADYWYYAYYGTTSSQVAGNNVPGVVVVKVNVAAQTSTIFRTGIGLDAPDGWNKPDDFSDSQWAKYGWFYMGQIAGKEVANGVEVAFTTIPYYVTASADGEVFRAWNPDYLQTICLTLDAREGATFPWSGKWTKRGCCVAQGIVRQRDYSKEVLTEGANYLLTEWEDIDSLQPTYHVREWDTGEIVGQVAYGRAAHVGGVGVRDLQVQSYVSDVNNPMLCSWKVYSELVVWCLVGIQSENQNGSVDVSSLLLQDWDHASQARSIWQNPASVMGFALSPGPVPTVFNGFQQLREAGPLVFPSRPTTYIDVGSS